MVQMGHVALKKMVFSMKNTTRCDADAKRDGGVMLVLSLERPHAERVEERMKLPSEIGMICLKNPKSPEMIFSMLPTQRGLCASAAAVRRA